MIDAQPAASRGGWAVQLDVFEGPFDLLLSLIARHRLDVTEVALAKVTDDFIAHLGGLEASFDLGQATEFLVVAATLLDLKAARLLPAASVEDEADVARLEARDLLFARLLQYRAFKQAAALLSAMLAREGCRHPRAVSLEERYARALPEVVVGVGPAELAQLAARLLTPRTPPVVSTDHISSTRVDVAEHVALLRERLAHTGGGSFRALSADCATTLDIVARFLALLDLYRDGLVGFDQVDPLGELRVRWKGAAPAPAARAFPRLESVQ